MSNPTETLRAILEAIPHPGGLEALDELETGHGWVYCPACGSCGVGGCCPHFCDKCSDIHDGDNNPVNLGDASGTRLRAAQNRIAELEASRKPQGTVLKETVADLLVEIDAHKAHAAQLEGKLAESNKANRILQTRLHNEGVNLHELDKEANALQAQVHTLREELERLRPYLRHNEICSFANKGNAEICCICGLNAATEVK